MSTDNLESQARDLRKRANALRMQCISGKSVHYSDERVEADRLESEADYLEGLEKQDGVSDEHY